MAFLCRSSSSTLIWVPPSPPPFCTYISYFEVMVSSPPFSLVPVILRKPSSRDRKRRRGTRRRRRNDRSEKERRRRRKRRRRKRRRRSSCKKWIVDIAPAHWALITTADPMGSFPSDVAFPLFLHSLLFCCCDSNLHFPLSVTFGITLCFHWLLLFTSYVPFRRQALPPTSSPFLISYTMNFFLQYVFLIEIDDMLLLEGPLDWICSVLFRWEGKVQSTGGGARVNREVGSPRGPFHFPLILSIRFFRFSPYFIELFRFHLTFTSVFNDESKIIIVSASCAPTEIHIEVSIACDVLVVLLTWSNASHCCE